MALSLENLAPSEPLPDRWTSRQFNLGSGECPLQWDFTGGQPYPVNCTSSKGFEFQSIYTITNLINQSVHETGLPDLRLSSDGHLTLAACHAITSTDGRGYTPYPLSDIRARFITWKSPLISLLVFLPWPATGLWSRAFVVIRFLGNPIGTLASLISTLSTYQRRAGEWQRFFTGEGNRVIGKVRNLDTRHNTKGADIEIHNKTLAKDFPRVLDDRGSAWKAVAQIVASYEERWGTAKGDVVSKKIKQVLLASKNREHAYAYFVSACVDTATALVPPNNTLLSMTILKQSLVVICFALGFFRIRNDGPYPKETFLNVEIHSLSSSALYFWIILAASLCSMVGITRTSATKRIWNRLFLDNLAQLKSTVQQEIANIDLAKSPTKDTLIDKTQLLVSPRPSNETNPSSDEGSLFQLEASLNDLIVATADQSFSTFDKLELSSRWLNKHISLPSCPNWQRSDSEIIASARNTRPLFSFFLRFSAWSLLAGYLGLSLSISWQVEPRGFSCSSASLVTTYFLWNLSFLMSLCFFRVAPVLEGQEHQLRDASFLKDSVFSILTTFMVAMSEIGSQNRCSCYATSNGDLVHMPQHPRVAEKLYEHFNTNSALLVFGGILCSWILIPYIPRLVYRDATHVSLHKYLDKAKATPYNYWSTAERETHLNRANDEEYDPQLQWFRRFEKGSLWATTKNFFSTLFLTSHLPAGTIRLNWICSCGYRGYDDFPASYEDEILILARNLAASGGFKKIEVSEKNSSSVSKIADSFTNLCVGLSKRLSIYFGKGKKPLLPTTNTTSNVGDVSSSTSTLCEGIPNLWLLLCVEEKWAPTLHHVNVSRANRDFELFTALRDRYVCARKRMSFFRRQLKCLEGIDFVKFKLHPASKVDITARDSVPPLSSKGDYRFIRSQYSPPIGRNVLVHFFHNPNNCALSALCLNLIPKKMDTRLEFHESAENEGFGLHFTERPNEVTILIGLTIATGASGVVFALCYRYLGEDVQTAGTIAGWVTAMFGLALALLSTWVWRNL